MTAEDAIKLGLENNFDIQIARNNASIASRNGGLGTASLLPSLDLSANGQRSSSDQVTNSPFSFGKSKTEGHSAQISFDWTLFDGFRMFADRRRFKELAKLGEYQARNIIENTVVSILRAYFNLVQQEQLLNVARNTLDVSQTRLNKARVRQDLGGASTTDLLNAQVSFNNDKATLLNQELRVLIAGKDLNILLARDPASSLAVKKEITIPPLEAPFQEMLERAEAQNSSLVMARQDRKVAEQNVRLARSAFLPRIFLNANYAATDRTLSSDIPRFPDDITTESTDKSMGATLSFNLFNGMRNRIGLQTAQLEAMNKDLAMRNARNQLAGLLRETMETFRQRIELVELEDENVRAASQNLQLQLDRYQIGTSSSLEFRDAQVNLARARTTLIGARYQARITRLELERLVGNLEID